MKPVTGPVAHACTRRQRPCVRGFTLVEVMVSLTILSLVMLATVTALRTLGNTQGAIDRMTARVDDVRTVSGFLRDILESAVVGSDAGGLSTGGGSRTATYFSYGEGFLELKSTILFGEGYGGSYLVRVAREGANLVLRWQESPDNGIPRDWLEMPSRVIVEQLEEFTVATRQEFGRSWSDDRNDGGPPALVRLQVKAAGRHWPDLILRVQR